MFSRKIIATCFARKRERKKSKRFGVAAATGGVVIVVRESERRFEVHQME